jgi:predicted porin
MNKKLVAVAIAGLLAAPLAQAQTANVTLYGRANLSMVFVNGTKPDGTNPNVYRVDSNSSRFGIRGTESLGGGLNAIFQIENGSINMSSTGGALAGRDTFLGLSGGWGKVYLGFYSAPYDMVTNLQGSNTANTGILGTGILWAQASQSIASGGFDSRLSNSIRYDSPTMAGFSGSAQFSTGEGSPSSNTNQQSYALNYANGPFSAIVAAEFHNNTRGVVNQSLDDSAWSIAAQWQFSMFNIAGTYEWLNYDAPTATSTNGASLKRKYWQINSSIKAGANGEVYLMYGSAGNGTGSAANGYTVGQLTKGSDTGASNWQVAYKYHLSKRTYVYTGYQKVNNDDNAAYNGSFNSIRKGANPGGFSMGMLHNF